MSDERMPLGSMIRKKTDGSGGHDEKKRARDAVRQLKEDSEQQRKKRQKKTKRKKNQPAEMPTNIPVSRKRQVVAPNHKARARDPRFDGGFRSANFAMGMKSYAFVIEKEKEEVKELERALRKAKTDDQRACIEEQLVKQKQTLSNHLYAIERQDIERRVKKRLIAERRPGFLKRREQREMYEEEKRKLKHEKGTLNKYLKNKAKKQRERELRSKPNRKAKRPG